MARPTSRPFTRSRARALGVRHLRTRPAAPRPTARLSASSAPCSAAGPTALIYGSAQRTAALDGWLYHYNHQQSIAVPRSTGPGSTAASGEKRPGKKVRTRHPPCPRTRKRRWEAKAHTAKGCSRTSIGGQAAARVRKLPGLLVPLRLLLAVLGLGRLPRLTGHGLRVRLAGLRGLLVGLVGPVLRDSLMAISSVAGHRVYPSERRPRFRSEAQAAVVGCSPLSVGCRRTRERRR